MHGRIKDALLAADGSRVTTWQVDRCFADADGIAHYELRQNENGSCELRYIPDANPPVAKTLDEVTARLESLLQTREKISVGLHCPRSKVPAASGKFRLTARVAA